MRRLFTLALIAVAAVTATAFTSDKVETKMTLSEELNFNESSQIIQNINQINTVGGMYGWFEVNGKMEQRFVKKEHLKYYTTILANIPDEQKPRAIKDRFKSGLMQVVDLSGGGTSPCPPNGPGMGASYYYNTSNGKYYCCFQHGCTETRPPYGVE